MAPCAAERAALEVTLREQFSGPLSPSEIDRWSAHDDGWAIGPALSRFLNALIRHARPQSVLEFGPGRSSLVIARALVSNGGGRVTSIEHAAEFARFPQSDEMRSGAI